MSYQALEVARDGAITWLTLNRPHALNALNAAITGELHDFLAGLTEDRTTRVVVMRGAGLRLLRWPRFEGTRPERRR